MSETDLMTLEQLLAELGGVSRNTFYRWRQLGKGPRSLRLPNGQLRFRRQDVRAWLDVLIEDAA
ncbi:helix-turn-helix transcriptional regulator [Actinomadura oligospora]|uniref:helix-turn-helix transcriptional regulator n=1 Tax=Actinomadura oligospora TaxID=111804 RepID=UPI00047D14F7|nr:helix-turn-helix domain-containing protein [Actinomadura oligospora]